MVRTAVGYSGGEHKDPTYHDLGDHSETVQVEFDPEKIGYEDLLRIFWDEHDPLSRSWSRQYRTAVFFTSDAQRRVAEASRDELAQRLGAEVRTEILPATAFHPAEDYHQKYYLRSEPALLRNLEAAYPDPRDLRRSTAAARLNGYAGGNGSVEGLRRDLDQLGLSPEAKRILEDLVGKKQRPD